MALASALLPPVEGVGTEAEVFLIEHAALVRLAVDVALAGAGGFDRNAPGIASAFPGAGRAKLGDNVGFDPAGFAICR